MDFETWWENYLKVEGNEVLSDYEKDVARAAWDARQAEIELQMNDAEEARLQLAEERANRDTAARVACEQANELLRAMGGDPGYSLLENAKRLRDARNAAKNAAPQVPGDREAPGNGPMTSSPAAAARGRLRCFICYGVVPTDGPHTCG